jgi:hypothetical protein
MSNMRDKIDRRGFVRGVGLAGIGLMALGTRAVAANDLSVSTDMTGKCGTCEFWGGVRKISADGKTVSFESAGAKGWCNNPKSPNYHKLTMPEQGPMPMWRKWGALG